jgi:hypothetical protein
VTAVQVECPLTRIPATVPADTVTIHQITLVSGRLTLLQWDCPACGHRHTAPTETRPAEVDDPRRASRWGPVTEDDVARFTRYLDVTPADAVMRCAQARRASW